MNPTIWGGSFHEEYDIFEDHVDEEKDQVLHESI